MRGNPTHLRQTHVNPVNLTTHFNTNNYLPVTNPNISVSSANRTFGGSSSSAFSSKATGIKGSSRCIASAGYFNKAYIKNSDPKKYLALNSKVTYNNSRSIIRNGYFIRYDEYGKLLNSNILNRP